MKSFRIAFVTLSCLGAAALLRAEEPAAAPVPTVKKYFYVYAPKNAQEINHYTPSGWMGDVSDLKFQEVNDGPKPGATCLKITYNAKGSKGAGWAGIFWQNPNNNWGSRPGGWNLSKFKKLTFMAKSEKKATINEFKMGGIQGTYGDTDSATIGPIELTQDWKPYTIDLAGKDLKRVIGGFCFSSSRDNNPDGFVLYLKDIRYEP